MRLTGAVAELGARALGALPAIPLYARVDLVEAGGHLLISELELIEPSLFLAHSPESAGIFAGAIRQRLTGGTGERLSGR
jgi:hypothetical protein